MHLVDRLAHLALHAVQRSPHALHLVLQLQYLLDAREVEAEIVRQLLDQPQTLDVHLGVQARVPGGALRADEALALVYPQRLWMHSDEVGGDRDHVTRTIVHHSPSFSRRSASSLRRMITNVTRTPTVPTLTRTIAAVFTRTTPPADRRETASAIPRVPRAPSSTASSERSRAGARSGRPCRCRRASERRGRGCATGGRPAFPLEPSAIGARRRASAPRPSRRARPPSTTRGPR